jgi:hypothetical protein
MMVENKINSGSGSEPTLVELKPFTTSIYTETLLANKSKDACVICSSPAVYKCPKCSIKTCSMGCSKAHKEKQSVSQKRKQKISFIGKSLITF